MKLQCVRAARNNCRILVDLWRCGKIGGFLIPRLLSLPIIRLLLFFLSCCVLPYGPVANAHILARYGYWESLHLFSGLSILLLSKVMFYDPATGIHASVATATTAGGFSNIGDAELYAAARSLLEEMARFGNPASKDHEALLTDVEQVVETVTNRQQNRDPEGAAPGIGQSGHHWLETIGTDDEIPLENFWQEINWENVLSGYTRINPN